MRSDEKWLEWAKELQFLSQSALAYCRDVYDIERFQRIRQISGEMMAALTDVPIERVQAIFLCETGYQTPKLDTRAAVIRDGRILLVQEKNGLWALPGGWVDADQSVGQNAVKEVREESGWTVRPLRLIALQEHNRHNRPASIHEICSAFVLCEPIEGRFEPNSETLACGFFAPDALPPLETAKTTPEQIRMCFDAAADPHWQVSFD